MALEVVYLRLDSILLHLSFYTAFRPLRFNAIVPHEYRHVVKQLKQVLLLIFCVGC